MDFLREQEELVDASETLRPFDRLDEFLPELLVALVWGQIQSVEAGRGKNENVNEITQDLFSSDLYDTPLFFFFYIYI